MRVAFGQFVVDTQAERLWKGGVEVRLRNQSLQVLLALLRETEEVVSRESLRKQLWGSSTYVEFDNGLNTALSRLREALEDDPHHPLWIERIPKRGYRFIGALPRSAAVAAYLKGHHVISPHSPENMQSPSPSFEKRWLSTRPIPWRITEPRWSPFYVACKTICVHAKRFQRLTPTYNRD